MVSGKGHNKPFEAYSDVFAENTFIHCNFVGYKFNEFGFAYLQVFKQFLFSDFFHSTHVTN